MTIEPRKVTPLAAFLSRSGYTAEDVLAHNEKTRLFVTSNGGKYHLSPKGTIRILKGPNYPKLDE